MGVRLGHKIMTMARRAVAAGLMVGLMVGLASPAWGGLEAWRYGPAAGRALVCSPEGAGPHAAVVYNHGLAVDRYGHHDAARRGYDLDGMCHALARAGFLAFMPIRAAGSGRLPRHLAEVSNAIDAAKERADVDSGRLALVGFSRGGLLALMAAAERSDLSALVVIAPAPGRGHFERALARVSTIQPPVLIMVEASDDGVILGNVDTLEQALGAAGHPATVIRYRRGGGHRLFWTVGSYWPDLAAFLQRHLRR